MKHREEAFFYFFVMFCFPLQTPECIANQMSQCGNVRRELEKTTILCFHHQKDLAHCRIHTGIIVYPGRMLLTQTITLPLHQHTRLFTSTLENGGVIWS